MRLALIHSSDTSPGYSRKLKGQKFVYLDKEGNRITDEETVARIKKLAIPPAWTNVWICAKPNGHLQATGTDALGRKQYKYHADWRLQRNKVNHGRMLQFGKLLPKIRKKIKADLLKRTWNKNKVQALAIEVLLQTYIRIGNANYSRKYGSFGLTTLKNHHIKADKNNLIIRFKGKKGVLQTCVLTNARLVRLLKMVKELPGKEIFQYYNHKGELTSLDSQSVNDYLKEITGNDYSAKDFRTWAGTLAAFNYLITQPSTTEPSEIRKLTNEAVAYAANQLGNTVSICKKHYVNPALLMQYEMGGLRTFQKRYSTKNELDKSTQMENLLISFLKKIKVEPKHI
ncbi:DNA topoisomerase I [Solitalea longa]|uniref:DNA topoisomerase I n=1 Tax=Solitalea longa TaxID=2079460 RepID=A0A2S5A3Z3_9SPHI|nr:DNA topoisomerase IB [Solitalea longa]POY37301.1 DNA topoisomerase I [Solitalea longa]